MRFIRSLLLLIYFIVFTVPYATACFIAFPFMRADSRYWMAAGWCRATLNAVRWLNGIRYKIEGMENLPNGPAVLLSKHQSAWETLAFPALMPRPLCYVFKRELLYVPFFGWALGLLKMVHIDRKEGKYAFESVIRQGKARKGVLVVMTFKAAPVAEEEAEEVEPELPAFAVEDKFDGIRAHAHKDGPRVALFSRTLDEVTPQFPEIAAALGRGEGTWLLDGEIVAWREGDRRPDSFFKLQRRLGRKAPEPELLAEIPTAFVAYDCLAAGGRPLFEAPWTERRAALEEIGAAAGIVVSEVAAASTAAELEALFVRARGRGNEGLVLKRRESAYQAGKRGRAWRKWKKALATLDVVVTAVEQGHGKRAGMLSDYTFAVRDGERLVNIGKAYSGLTDEEIRRLGTRFRRETIERYGPVRAVQPTLVIEVSFDSIQKSARHKSGFALRFPRIVRIREDKPVAEITTLDDVRELYARLEGEGRTA